jgi:hypothetical protein
VYGIILIISGIILNFGGFRLTRTTLILSGFILFSVLTNIASEHYHFGDQIAFILTIYVGLLGSFISFSFPVIGENALGMSGGISFVLIILSAQPGGEWTKQTALGLFLSAGAMAGVILIHAARKSSIILSSSLLGSYISFNGFVRTNLIEEKIVYNYIGIVLVVSIFGAFVQFMVDLRLSTNVKPAPEILVV